jgi:hypothetical protein
MIKKLFELVSSSCKHVFIVPVAQPTSAIELQLRYFFGS